MNMKTTILPTISINDDSFQPAMNNNGTTATTNLSGNMDGGNPNVAANTNNSNNSNNNNNNNSGGITLPVPSVFSFQSYAKYFDFDTIDIQNRITGSITFANRPNHFREQVLGGDGNKGPDLYGPLWITMTLVFVVAVSTILLIIPITTSM